MSYNKINQTFHFETPKQPLILVVYHKKKSRKFRGQVNWTSCFGLFHCPIFLIGMFGFGLILPSFSFEIKPILPKVKQIFFTDRKFSDILGNGKQPQLYLFSSKVDSHLRGIHIHQELKSFLHGRLFLLRIKAPVKVLCYSVSVEMIIVCNYDCLVHLWSLQRFAQQTCCSMVQWAVLSLSFIKPNLDDVNLVKRNRVMS